MCELNIVFCLRDLKISDRESNWCRSILRRVTKKYSEILKYEENCPINRRSSMESSAIKMVVLALQFACFALASPARRCAWTCERNNIVKREGLLAARSRQIHIEIDLITSASCRDAVFTSVLSWTRAGQRDQESERTRDEASNSRECESVVRL